MADATATRMLDPLDPRIPLWPPHELERRSCPICAGEGEPFAQRPDKLFVRFCTSCDMTFVSPAPNERALEEFYRNYDATHRRGRPVGPRELVEVFAGMDPTKDYRLRRVSALCPLPGKRLLDVGFGRAGILSLASRLGAQVEGLELDARAVDIARRRLGLTGCRFGKIEDLPRVPTYDVIMMMDLIEHVLQPMRTLEDAIARLLPGGVLVLWTPNGGGLRSDDTCIQLRVDLEHVQYFSSATIRKIAASLGLTVRHLETTGHPDLTGMEMGSGTANRQTPLSASIVSAIKSMPGYRYVERVRRRDWKDPLEDTDGSYHLFTILQTGLPAPIH